MADLQWGAMTDPGRLRPENEDSYLATGEIFVVADGMGGHQAGEVASALAVERMRERLDIEDAVLDTMVDAVTDANTAIFDAALGNETQQGMGTTITALAVIKDVDGDEALALANVGDSRTYLFRHERLRRVTVDHNYVQELVDTGHITADEARTHPRRNIVTRALGVEPSVKVDAWMLPLIRGDRFLLCSDGLNDEVPDEDIAHVLATHDDPQRAADRLVEMANDSGGRDNISVIVVDVRDGAEPPPPDQELDVEPLWGAEQPTEELPALDVDGYVADEPVETAASDGEPVADDNEQSDDGNDVATAAAATVAPSVRDESATAEMATADISEVSAAGDQTGRRPRKRRVGRFVVAVTIVVILVLTFVVVAAWARRGYYVGFDNADRVIIYQGRPGGVLWFDPTEEARTSLSRDDLDAESVDRVEREPTFESRRQAELYINESLVTTTVPPPTTTTEPEPPDTTDADRPRRNRQQQNRQQQDEQQTSNATPPTTEP